MAEFGDVVDLLKCSFCGKTKDHVKKLIAGPGVYICDECLDLCNEIVEEELGESGSVVESGPVIKKRGVPVRIQPKIEGNSERTAQMLASTKGLNGDGVLNIFATLAHHPRALTHGVALGGAFMFRSTIGDRNREIVIIRVARNTRCEYEYAQHFLIGQACGLGAEECERLLQPMIGEAFSDFECSIVASVDALCRDNEVPDALWNELSSAWDDQQMIEFVMLTGYYRMLAGFLNSAGVEIDAGLAGFPTHPPA